MIGGQALFWSGVLYNEAGAYDRALNLMNRLPDHVAFKQSEERTMLPFELGFAYMALKDYTAAQRAFLSYLSQNVALAKGDEARLNLADCYFANKDYTKALAQYNKVKDAKGVYQDYADFQAAMCLEFTQGLAEKAMRLVDFLKTYPNSVYRDQVYFSLGSAYVNLEKIPEAQLQFKALISGHKSSPLVASAYLNLGLISDNNEAFEDALDYFKNVVNLYPGSQEAISAVQSARNTFIALGRVQEYGLWVNDLDFISIEEAALDQASFESAKQAYAQGNDVLSIQRLESYLENYPQGRYTLEVHYFLSEIYWRQQNIEQALIHADPVIKNDQNPSYVIPTLIRVVRHYLSIQEFAWAESSLIQLMKQPLDADQRSFALRNLMQMMSDGSRWREALDYAEQLSSHLSPGGDEVLLAQAKLTSAWSHFELGEFEMARAQYQGMDAMAKGQYGAQMTLARAYFAHLDQDYLGSNDSIQYLAQNYANHPKYGARGLMLMALNFEALEDSFQARFILENIRDNMSDFPDLQEEATRRMAQMDESKRKTQESSHQALGPTGIDQGIDQGIEQDSLGSKGKNEKQQND
ncbi:MAG TPA: hypothetical protein DCZ44_02180 [Flavobacteriaceae bacterium]|nr:hypothetical protein [Flavobacteriaceae bacterium]